MLNRVVWTEEHIKHISLPPADLLPEKGPNYLCALSQVGEEELHNLTPESAQIIARLHPIIVWSKKKHCICGRRTFHLIANRIPENETVPVGILPEKTNKEELKQLIYADVFLGMLAFAVKDPATNLFQFSRLITKKTRKKLSPALAGSVDTCSKFLGATPPTLYRKTT